MSKAPDVIVIGSDCEKFRCRYFAEIDNKKVYCGFKEKEYYYGQCIPCENHNPISEEV